MQTKSELVNKIESADIENVHALVDLGLEIKDAYFKDKTEVINILGKSTLQRIRRSIPEIGEYWLKDYPKSPLIQARCILQVHSISGPIEVEGAGGTEELAELSAIIQTIDFLKEKRT